MPFKANGVRLARLARHTHWLVSLAALAALIFRR
jgi:hypothetical protein